MPAELTGTAQERTQRISRHLAGTAMQKLVAHNLRGVWVRGCLPQDAAVWVSNHHSWWDFFVAAAAMGTRGRADIGVLVDPSSMGNERLFRSAGAIPFTELRSGIEILVNGSVLVVFVEGELRPVGPVGAIAPGADWLAKRSGAPIVVVATRVVLRGQQAPEAYLDVSAPVQPQGDLQARLGAAVAGLDRELAAADPTVSLPGFEQVLRGRRSWHERFGGAMVTR